MKEGLHDRERMVLYKERGATPHYTVEVGFKGGTMGSVREPGISKHLDIVAEIIRQGEAGKDTLLE